MKTEAILEREEYNKEHEGIVESLEKIISSLERIENKLSKIIGENDRRLNETIHNKNYMKSYKQFIEEENEKIYNMFNSTAGRGFFRDSSCTSKVDGCKED